jgi:hypothetical protein
MLPILQSFRNSIATSQGLIATAYSQGQAGAYLLAPDIRSTIVEAAFLKIFIGWESLLETTFHEFLIGTPSAAGTAITRYGVPVDGAHAHRMTLGSMRYVDWSSPEVVRKLGRNFFLNGDPFETVLASLHSDLIDLKTIRNSAAHLSSTTSAQLDALAGRKLRRAITGMGASDLLLSIDPNSPTNETILQVYVSILDAAAYRITHV